MDQKPSTLTAITFFFFFGLHLFLDQKGVTLRNSAPGATIPSNTTGVKKQYGKIVNIMCAAAWPKELTRRLYDDPDIKIWVYFKPHPGDVVASLHKTFLG